MTPLGSKENTGQKQGLQTHKYETGNQELKMEENKRAKRKTPQLEKKTTKESRKEGPSLFPSVVSFTS